MSNASPVIENNQAGFTLIEMLVVLAIIGMVAAVSFPYFNPLRKADTEKVASSILHVAQLARLSAMKERVSKEVSFDTAQGLVQTQGSDESVRLPQGMKMSVLTGRELISSDQTARILFLSDGSSTGGDIIISTQVQSTKVQVNWLTGIASIVAVSHE